MEKKKSKLSILFAGLLKENPVFVLILGTCPTLAISTTVLGGVGMGVAATAVLICSNFVISLLKNIIPDKVRIPAYIVTIAGFVTIVQLLVKAYAPALDETLGLYLPLIVVNCIILGRAEMFASKNSAIDSVLDGLGMGIGFTLALFIMGTIREILGSGSWAGIPLGITPMSIISRPPGGFFVYGVVIAAINFFTKGKAIKRKSMGCAGCGQAESCPAAEGQEA